MTVMEPRRGKFSLISGFPQLIIKELIELLEALGTGVMSKFLGNYEFLLDLIEILPGGDHFGNFVAHDDEVAFLLFEIFHAAPDVRGPVTGDVGFHRKISRHDVVEDLYPALDVGIENSRRFALSRVN